MKLALILAGFFLLAVAVGNLALDDPGVIVIAYKDKLVQTSLALFLAMLVIGLVLLYAVARLLAGVLFMRSKLGGWYHDKRARRARDALTKGYIALAEADWPTAERTLISDASVAPVKLLHYFGAAYAAQQQGALDRRDDYLSLASEAEPRAQLAVALTQAEMQLNQGQWEEAEASLLRLRETHPKSPRLLSLLHRFYRQRGRWQELPALLDLLAKTRLLDDRELEDSRQRAYAEMLDQAAADPSFALDRAWDRIPARLRGQAALLLRYCRHLVDGDRVAAAERLLRKRLGKELDRDLLAFYAELPTEDPLAQLTAAEAWLENGADPDLLHALGRLAYRAGLWAKARSYLEKCLDIEPSVAACRLLADTLDRMGEPDKAARISRKGLSLAADAGRLPVLAKT